MSFGPIQARPGPCREAGARQRTEHRLQSSLGSHSPLCHIETAVFEPLPAVVRQFALCGLVVQSNFLLGQDFLPAAVGPLKKEGLWTALKECAIGRTVSCLSLDALISAKVRLRMIDGQAASGTSISRKSATRRASPSKSASRSA